MNIEIICVGKLKENYWAAAIAEYSKRLQRFCKLTITELPETMLKGESAAEEQAVIRSESEAIAKKLKPGNDSYIIALDVVGKPLSSEELAEKISTLTLQGKSRIVFVIGGSLGMTEELKKSCDFRISFSKMTFPHQMMRVILVEQIYRAFKINNNEKYHK